MRSIAALAAMALVAVVLVAAAPVPARAATGASTPIAIDGAQPGPTFDGIGAISGGGGNSRYLIDYPDPERSEILDYLFRPGYGASLQMLKLEIGGDSDSSDGAEPSDEHTPGDIDCDSGYEWWLAEQAVARNPAIKLYGLQWAAPGWTGTWTSQDISYLLDWLRCASSHGLTISYLGGWNERSYDAGWFIALRQALDDAGYGAVQIVAADEAPVGNTSQAAVAVGAPGAQTSARAAAARASSSKRDGGPARRSSSSTASSSDPTTAWQIANDMAADPSLASAIAVIGAHDTCGYPTTGYSCTSTATAQSLGKPLWESELGGMDATSGASDIARAVNNGFVQAEITGFLTWPLVDSMPPGLPFEDRGLVTADQPWSGNYVVNQMTWAIAQTTQFVPAGWQYVGGGDGALAGGGTYVAYHAPDASQWSLVTETTEAAAAQTIAVRITGGLPDTTVRVWATDLASDAPSSWFLRWPDVKAAGGSFSYTLPPGYAVTFTTSTGEGKGTAGSPPPATMALPYSGLPELSATAVPESEQPPLLAAQDGAFEYSTCGDGSGLQCVQQLASGTPIWWYPHAGVPYAVLGDQWGSYQVSGEISFTNQGQTAGLIGRFGGQTGFWAPQEFNGYELELSQAGAWQLVRNSVLGATSVLASGHLPAIAPDSWQQLSLAMNGGWLIVAINGQQTASVQDANYGHGLTGVITQGFYDVRFRNLAVSSIVACTVPRTAYDQGFDRGYDAGYDRGFRAGYQKAVGHKGGGAAAKLPDARAATYGGEGDCQPMLDAGYNAAFHTGDEHGFQAGFNRGWRARHKHRHRRRARRASGKRRRSSASAAFEAAALVRLDATGRS